MSIPSTPHLPHTSMRHTRILVCILSTAWLCMSCSSVTTVHFNAQRPPDVDVSPYQRAVVEPIESSSMFHNDGSALRNQIIEKLLVSHLFEAVSDTHSAAYDTSATLSISGSITNDKYVEQRSSSDEKVGRKVRNPVTKKDTVIKDSVVHHYAIKGMLTLSSQIRLRDQKKNTIVWSSSFDLNIPTSSEATNAKPVPINVDAIQRDALNQMSDKVIQSFLVKNCTEKAELVEDSDLAGLDDACKLAADNDYHGALRAFEQICTSQGSYAKIHEAWYNQACMQMVLGQYDSALQNFNKAITMNPGEKRYTSARDLCVRIQNDAAVLKSMQRH